MPTFTSYPPGTPCWVDLASPDPAASRDFYTTLFGWTAKVDDRPEAGGYGQFFKGDHATAGVGPLWQEGMPAAWTTYISTDDADATAASITANGGTIMTEPFDIFTAGRMAVFAGPDGAIAGIWQPIDHHGAGVANEPGAWNFNMLATRAPDVAKRFLGSVFGWEFVESDVWGSYFALDGHEIAGLLNLDDLGLPPQVPAHWQAVFTVDDADATVAKAIELGGSTHGPVQDYAQGGRMGAAADPHGAAFGLVSFPPRD